MPTSRLAATFPYAQRLLLIAVAALLAACATPEYVIKKPDRNPLTCSDPAGQACGIPVEVQWRGVAINPTPELYLDRIHKPGVLGPSGNSVVGSLTAPVGNHEIMVSGALSGQGGVRNYSATANFTIDPAPGNFALAAQPNNLVIERGAGGAVQIRVSRTAPFAGAVALSLATPPSGISAAATTAAAASGNTTANLQISVANAAAPGRHRLTVSGSAAPLNATTTLNLLVARTTGLFREASPAPYFSTVPSSANSQAGGFRVDLALGGTSYPTGWRTATFFQGTRQIGQPIGYTIGTINNLAGAGFCANTNPTALTRGVVMSGAQPGYSSQNVLRFVDLVGNMPVQDVPVNQAVQLGNVFHSFQPRVFFSPDCTLALVAAANSLGPSPNIISLWDLQRSQPLRSDIPLWTDIFQAEVGTGGSGQFVSLRMDTGTANAQTTQISIP